MGKIKYIRKEGGSRVLALGEFLPDDWRVVECKRTRKGADSVTIKIDKVK